MASEKFMCCGAEKKGRLMALIKSKVLISS